MSRKRHFLASGSLSADLYLLTGAAGMMDALSYLRSGVFTANMTGNTVVLGLGLAGVDRSRLPRAALAIGAFAIGVLLAAAVFRRIRSLDPNLDLRLGTALELPFLAAFALLWMLSPSSPPRWIQSMLILTAASALGIQSVAVRRLSILGVVTTFITGTITTAIVSLMKTDDTGAKQPGDPSPWLLFGILVCYALAAALGVTLTRTVPRWTGLVPLVIVAAVQLRSL